MSDRRDLVRGIDRRSVLKQGILGAAGAVVAGGARASRSREDCAVAVIGAGISGLSAARELKRAGINDFVVLEARDRVGGRTLNADIGGGHVTELGGQWIGPTQTAVADLARELGLELFLTNKVGKTAFVAGGKVDYVDTSALIDPTFAQTIDALAASIPLDAPWAHPDAAKLDAMTYADWLATQPLTDEQKWTVRLGAMLTYGAPPEALSWLWTLFYARSAGSYAELEGTAGEGAQMYRVVGGSQALSLAMARELGAKVRLATPVATIRDWGSTARCTIETPSRKFIAQRVIVALSPSQAELIAFDPPLPDERRDLQKAWPSAVDAMKAFLVYDEPFWRAAGLSGQSFLVDPSAPYGFGWDNSPPDGGRGVLACFINMPTATSWPMEERRAAMIAAVTQCFGAKASNPLAYYEHKWLAEQYTRGCISPLAPGVLTRYGKSLRPALGALEWAGTETALVWNGYMDGAVRAGREAAQRTLRSLFFGPSRIHLRPLG